MFLHLICVRPSSSFGPCSLLHPYTRTNTQVAAKEMETIKGDLAKKKKKSEKMKPMDDDNMSMVSDMTGECLCTFFCVCVGVSRHCTVYLCRPRTRSPSSASRPAKSLCLSVSLPISLSPALPLSPSVLQSVCQYVCLFWCLYD